MAESKKPPQDPTPPPPEGYWVYTDKQVQGPYSLRRLSRMKDFLPEMQVAPTGAKTTESWKPAADYPEIKTMFEARATVQPKPQPAPAKSKPARRPPLQPLPEEPNYLLWGVGVLIVAIAVFAIVQSRRSRSESEAPAATEAGTESAPAPEQMWPEPNAPAQRLAAEGKLLESYFPLLLSAQGIKPEQIPAACNSAKEFVAGYDDYKFRFAPYLNSFSQRVALTMRSDARTPALLERLELASKRGVDLSSLKYAKNLRQNMSLVEFGLERAQANARFLLSSLCASQEDAP